MDVYINDGAIGISDVYNPDVELACILLDYIAETTSDEKDVLTNFIQTTSATLLRELVEMLESTRNALTKEIDKIARFQKRTSYYPYYRQMLPNGMECVNSRGVPLPTPLLSRKPGLRKPWLYPGRHFLLCKV
jgi:hypothetical protein